MEGNTGRLSVISLEVIHIVMCDLHDYSNYTIERRRGLIRGHQRCRHSIIYRLPINIYHKTSFHRTLYFEIDKIVNTYDEDETLDLRRTGMVRTITIKYYSKCSEIFWLKGSDLHELSEFLVLHMKEDGNDGVYLDVAYKPPEEDFLQDLLLEWPEWGEPQEEPRVSRLLFAGQLPQLPQRLVYYIIYNYI